MKNIQKLIISLALLMLTICASAADIPNNEIWYTNIYGTVTKPYVEGIDIFGAKIVSNKYENGKGVIKFDNDVTTIGEKAFFCQYSSIESIILPNTVTSIGKLAFAYDKIAEITIPNSVNSIAYNAFFDYDEDETMININIIDFADDNKVINSIVGCTFDTHRKINYRYYYENNEVKGDFVVPAESIIGDKVLYGCNEIKSIIILGTVTSIGNGAFQNCKSLEKAKIDYVRAGNKGYYYLESIGDYAFVGCESLSSINIPGSVTNIGTSAFKCCSSLTSVTIPNSVTSIGEYAFSGCTSLPVIDNIRYADTYLIEAVDKSFSTYEIKNNTRWIGNGAFYNCFNLTNITIPNSIISIASDAFSGCYIQADNFVNNSSLDAETNNHWGATIYDQKTDDGFLIKDNCIVRYIGNNSSVSIPNYITSIGERAFMNCLELTSISIPSSIVSIEKEAFYGCGKVRTINWNSNVSPYCVTQYCGMNLKEVSIGSSVKSIGEKAFYYCSGLTSIIIPNSVTSIGSFAFSGCSGLTSIAIPKSVISLGSDGIGNDLGGMDVFQRCTGLTSIEVEKGNPVYDSRDNCNAIIETKSNTLLFGCKTATIPNTIVSIGKCAFLDYSGLTNITIPNSVTIIDEHAFSYAGLTSITIPASVTTIGDGAFFCRQLNTINVNCLNPISIDKLVFYNYDATLYVPSICISKYKSADVWKEFKNIRERKIVSIEFVSNTQTTLTLKVVDLSDKSIPYEEIGVEYDNKYYKANSEGIVKVDYCEPGKEITVYSYAKYGGEYYVSELGTSVRTKPINSEIAFSDIMANKAFVRGVYDIGDAHVYKTTFELKIPTEYGPSWTEEEIEYKNDKFTLTGLEPDTEYGVCYTVYYHYGENDEYSGSEYDKQYFTTAKLKMKTLNPKNVSSASSVVAAEANISDDETGVGFEWRKYDAPESLPSSKGGAIVYDGRMEGKINNLQPVYYNVRPYYESASGKMFYGDWITFDPTDFSYFEPTVHTYDFIDNPTTNSVEVRGYVMQGTDAVTEQGFEYWKTGKASKSKAAGNDVMRIQASGQMMIATLKDLDFESNYIVRAYVTTASGTIYGEERSFTTPKATPEKTLGDANMDGSINVNDITTIAKFILEGNVSPWSEVNADANEDGTINVSDITKTAEIILLRAKAEMEVAQSKK